MTAPKEPVRVTIEVPDEVVTLIREWHALEGRIAEDPADAVSIAEADHMHRQTEVFAGRGLRNAVLGELRRRAEGET